MIFAQCYEEFLASLLRADRATAGDVIRLALAGGADAGELLLHVVQPSMEQVGVLWSRRQASLTQYFVAGRIADDVTDTIVPLLERPGGRTERGRVVLGTIAGDHHGLGRKVVAAFLRASGLYVRDLGLGVAPAEFAAAAIEERADILAVSALMLRGVEQIKQIRPLLAAQGADDIRLVVGGAPFNYHKRLYRQVGADATAADAGDAVRIVHALLAGGAVR